MIGQRRPRETTRPGAALRFAVAGAVAACFAANAFAGVLAATSIHRRALIETSTLTVTGEAVRVYSQVVDIGSGALVGPAEWLPGASPAGRIAYAEYGRHVALVTRASAYVGPALDETYVSVIDGPSNRLAPDGWLISEYGWRHTAACFSRRADGSAALLVTLSRPALAKTVSLGRIEARTLSQHRPVALTDKPASWLLPGTPVDAAALPDSPLVAVLCDDTQYGPILHIRDVDRGEVVVERRVLFEGARGLVAEALKLNGPSLLALATGPKSGQETARDASWVRAVATGSWECVGAPLELSGVALEDSPPIVPADGDRYWIATGDPVRGFAYVACVGVDGTHGPVKFAEHSFSGISRALRVAPAATEFGVALGVGERVHVWRDGNPGVETISFGTPVSALAWLRDEILVGEGNRVHRIGIDDASAIGLLAEFQTGVVTRIIPLSDSDSRDEPGPEGEEVYKLALPRVVHFRGESAGRELRAIQIGPPTAPSGTWRLEWNQNRTPWLNAYPTSGTIPGWFFLGVDGNHHVRGTTDTGWVDLHLDLSGGRAPDSGAVHRIVTRVAPAQSPIRRILWALGDAEQASRLRSADDPYALRALADLLASPPLHFSHHVAAQPVGIPLTEFSVVVLETNAILSGIVTRHALLDYVSRGGALLYVVQPLDGHDPATVARWLSPAGLAFDPANRISDRFVPVENAPLTRHCEGWPLREAVSTSVDETWHCLVRAESSGGTGLAVREYGGGRIAVLAARAPLESSELQRVAARRFMADLFQWLGSAGRDVKDLDADGLPDSVEDANGDGAVNPGETDRMNPDSDGDGVPDGAEDRNRNGKVDAGETDPRNPDTDGDGIFDGADLLPLLGAPKAAGP